MPVHDSDNDINIVFALAICGVAQKGMSFGHLCYGSSLLSCLAMQGVAMNKDIMSLNELLMDIESADLGHPLVEENLLKSFTSFIEKMRWFIIRRCLSCFFFW